jgi:hypothetical protein
VDVRPLVGFDQSSAFVLSASRLHRAAAKQAARERNLFAPAFADPGCAGGREGGWRRGTKRTAADRCFRRATLVDNSTEKASESQTALVLSPNPFLPTVLYDFVQRPRVLKKCGNALRIAAASDPTQVRRQKTGACTAFEGYFPFACGISSKSSRPFWLRELSLEIILRENSDSKVCFCRSLLHPQNKIFSRPKSPRSDNRLITGAFNHSGDPFRPRSARL